MKKITSFSTLMLFCINIALFAQSTAITLTGSQYVETFDGIGSGLPNGWTIKTAAMSNASGSDAALTTAATLWNNTSGRFNNYASADIGETGDQNTATDRVLGVRQTGTFGDPNAAFVVKLANTTGLNGFNLSFKLQSLDKASARTTVWGVEYAIGDSSIFTAATTTPATLSTGGATFTNQNITVNFGSTLDNKSSNVWIRLRATTASSGSGSRASTAIDDFTLAYSGGTGSNMPTITASPLSISFATTEGVSSGVKSYNLSGSNLTGDINLTVKSPFEISKSENSGFGTSLSYSPTNGAVSTSTVYVRMSSATTGSFTDSIVHSSTGAVTQKLALSGIVRPPVQVVSIATAKGLADSSFTAISGRLTVTTQFGGRLIYVQDNTAGMAVFGASATAFPNTWQIGDSVMVAGMVVTFNGLKEIVNITQASLIVGQTNKPLSPIVITPDQQLAYEGSLVTIKEATFVQSGNFANNTNYDFANCNSIYSIFRITGATANNLVGTEIPKNTRNVTGIMGIFNTTPQLQPRFAADIAAVSTNQCTITGVCSPTAVLTADNNLERTKTFDIAAWNVEWLGHPVNGATNEQLQQDNVKCVVEKLKSDIIVMVEVCDTTKMKALIPAGYDYKCSAQYYSHFFDTPETAADPAQKVCVAYNKTTVSPINAECKALLTTNATFTANSPDNSFWASGRLPYLFTANVTVDGTTRKVRVVGIHAKAGSALADYNRRLTDVQALKKELDDNYSKDFVILAGDFNDDLDTSIATGQASSYANFVRDTANYRGLTKVLSDAKKRSTVSQTDMVDHIVISNELFSAYEDKTADVATATSIDFIKAYRSTTTDHYPVWARFDLKRTTVNSIKTIAQYGNLEAHISPNPTNGQINISIKTDKAEDVDIAVYNMVGQRVVASKQYLTNGENTIRLDIQNLKSGLYHFFIKQGDKAKMVKVVKM